METEPDLIVWQVGIDDALAQAEITAFAEALDGTSSWFRSHDIDAVLVEPPYTAALATDTHYTAGRRPDGEPRPDPAGNILVFPYIEGGSEVNAKYRTISEKRFWQRKDARKKFFNADVLDDPAFERGDHALVITEGELDALAAIQSGFPFTVSCRTAPRRRETNRATSSPCQKAPTIRARAR